MKPEDTPGENLAKALREVYPRNTAKLIARDFDVKEETARTWIAFDERMPQANLLLAMFRKYGPTFMVKIDPDAVWASQLRLESDIEDLKTQAAALYERIQNFGGRD